MMPRCLCVIFSERSVLFILRIGCVSGILFVDIKRGVVLVGLKSTNQLSAQWCIVPRSELRVSCRVRVFNNNTETGVIREEADI